jgi:hypothetical protein
LVLIGGGPSNADTLAALAGSDDRPEARREDIELFIHRDVVPVTPALIVGLLLSAM